MNISIMSKKGCVVIPYEFRERYNLKKGDRLHFIDYGGVISIIPASESPIQNSHGILKSKDSLVNELLISRLQDAKYNK
jgi:AbrB family looped-hinge helix DNA binding protein